MKDEEGNTPLHIACLYNHVKVASVLLSKGADPFATDNRGTTHIYLNVYLFFG
jgi:ankyrin repeat protein